MPATSKNKRKIHVNGRDFYWTGYDDRAKYITVMTSDKQFYAKYHIVTEYNQSNQNYSVSGEIVVEKAEIPELSHVQNGLQISTPDWTSFHDWGLPSLARRITVYIFETLKA